VVPCGALPRGRRAYGHWLCEKEKGEGGGAMLAPTSLPWTGAQQALLSLSLSLSLSLFVCLSLSLSFSRDGSTRKYLET